MEVEQKRPRPLVSSDLESFRFQTIDSNDGALGIFFDGAFKHVRIHCYARVNA